MGTLTPRISFVDNLSNISSRRAAVQDNSRAVVLVPLIKERPLLPWCYNNVWESLLLIIASPILFRLFCLSSSSGAFLPFLVYHCDLSDFSKKLAERVFRRDSYVFCRVRKILPAELGEEV